MRVLRSVTELPRVSGVAMEWRTPRHENGNMVTTGYHFHECGEQNPSGQSVGGKPSGFFSTGLFFPILLL